MVFSENQFLKSSEFSLPLFLKIDVLKIAFLLKIAFPFPMLFSSIFTCVLKIDLSWIKCYILKIVFLCALYFNENLKIAHSLKIDHSWMPYLEPKKLLNHNNFLYPESTIKPKIIL